MSTRYILTLTVAALLAAPVLHAQTAAPGTAPATPPAGGATTPAATPPAGTTPATPAAPAAKPKALSSSETKAITGILEVLQFHIRLSESAKWKKDDEDLSTFGQKSHKELTAQFTPMVNYAMAHGVDNKNIPAEATKADKQDISKLGKEKGDKYKLEYFELYSKQGKRNIRTTENAVKSFSDPELKDLGTKILGVLTTQTELAETKFKELKGKK